ncbi:DUF4190 domain-containing protein [Mycobacteroides abscessus]|uniref:DUF4190 domain-containing protein n=1 Tax=Mycobacteroides abscessus TaxID=36809 RepID=UPI0005161EBB|nr:DUF4190 domain-containing protein [Mycobacteroides abscessus]AMU21495.1 hypothetical protein A3N95_12260 [Mycobacteroides abscessus]ORA26750.1 DUF4190 domain-containing protein [Mycobacteroides abscessus subsp. bolletii]TPF69565.1 hypothetical protein XW60_02565 [Mycobacteroides abscessus subsp. bolletii]SHZ10039.1 Uncharacterised protein [Mycobacteroides abscessus subsp. bolletii]SHZ36700.1 Uncharacterised protein [Mycobacteroides abscessus subsp. bolletii]
MTETPPPPPPYQPAGGYPPPFPYPYPYGAPGVPVPPPAPKNGLGLSALVIGIVSVLLSCTVFGGLFGGLVAVVLGIAGLLRVKRAVADNRGVAIAGIALGSLAVLLSAAILVFTLVFMKSAGLNDFISCLSEVKGDQAKATQCQSDFEKRMNEKAGTSKP